MPVNVATLDEFHGRLLQDTVGREVDDRDAFLLFLLFHTFRVELAGPVLTDYPNMGAGGSIAALTQRGCAAALASLWQATDDQRGDYMYWYRRWNGEWGSYGHSENLSNDEAVRLRELTSKLEGHAFVQRFVPED